MPYRMWVDKFGEMDLNLTGGKTLFCQRLGWYYHHHKLYTVTGDREHVVDLSLNAIQIQNPNARKKILRLDGVYHDLGKDWKAKNIGMVRALRNCDGVVYQSQHAKRLADRYLGEAQVPTAIIFNGSEPGYYDRIPPYETTKVVVMAVSKWRPHKRLTDIVESFLLAQIPDSKLVIAGDVSNSGVSSRNIRRYKAMDSIRFIGHVPQDVLASYYRVAIASVHLCWFDACPNSVVEALCAGVPVVTNNVGGTHELVQKAISDPVLICDLDEEYDLQPVDLYHPPVIDRNKVAQALRHCYIDRPSVDRSALTIDVAAEQYKLFMDGLL